MTVVRAASRRGLLALKINRFEVVAVTAAALVLAGAALYVTYEMSRTGATRACMEQLLKSLDDDDVSACARSIMRWSNVANGEGGKVLGAMFGGPFIIGAVLGVLIVGRQIEERTATIAWALSGSRRRWLAGALWPPLLLTLLLGVLLAAASAVLGDSKQGLPIWFTSFDDALFAGPPVMAHLLLGLAIGLITGAVVGRTLPALIVAVVAVGIVAAAALSFQTVSKPEDPLNTIGVGPGAIVDKASFLRTDWAFRVYTPTAAR